ncbi:RDH13, partial [Symbiodinium sp. KB8]
MSSPKRILSSPTFLAASAVGTAALGVLGRKYFQGGVNTHAPDMSGKVILITGANTGIGRETARTIAGLGGLVVMACRSEERAREAMKDIEATHPEAQLEFLQLDLASFDSIRKAAAEFKAKHDKLHVLINNAGIMMCPEWRTKEGFEMQVGVNHIGHFLLTSLLLDSLKAAAPARIINVSSRSHYEGEIHWDDINYFKRKYSKLEAYGQVSDPFPASDTATNQLLMIWL